LKYSNLTDEEIVDKIIGESKNELFGVLYNRYFPKVKDKCYSFFKDKQKSEEFANDILSKSFEKLETFKGKSSFSSWLYSVTYNHCIDYLREKKKLHYPKWSRENELPEIIDDINEVVEEINYDQFLEILELIHPEEKALLLMKYKDDVPMKQVAVSLRISEDAAKMRLKRARTRIIYLYKTKFA